MKCTFNLAKNTYNLNLWEDLLWSMYAERILHNSGFTWARQQKDNPQQLYH